MQQDERAGADPGVPLAHYRTHDGCGVLLVCLGCMKQDVLELEAVIARLRERGLGDEQTGVRAVAWFVERPCGRCGGLAFETRPAFASPEKGPEWRSPPPD